MTTEYDELLARLDVGTPLGKSAAAAIRALTAQVVERDAVIEQASHESDCGTQQRGCMEERCTHRHWTSGQMPTHTYGSDCPPRSLVCTCWKSQAPRDALTAHDKTVRATALRDAADSYAADGYVTGEHTQGFFGIGDWEGEPDEWLRARADQEEAQ